MSRSRSAERPTRAAPADVVDRSVSVLIAAYNCERTIGRAIASALAQPDVVQVLVVDDCSRDGTVEAALALDDGSGRLEVVRQSINQGPSAARNVALDRAEGCWVAVLDSDDYMQAGRIAALLDAADGADLVADDPFQVDEGETGPPVRTMLGGGIDKPTPISLERFVLSNIPRRGRARQELGFLKPLILRSLLRENGIRYNERLRLGEDYELYCRLLAAGGRLIVLPAKGYVAEVRSSSLSAVHSAEDLRRLRDSNLPLLELPGLSASERQAIKSNYGSVDCRLQWLLLIDAVKSRDAGAALRTMMRPFPVPLYLARALLEQAYLRLGARLRGEGARGPRT